LFGATAKQCLYARPEYRTTPSHRPTVHDVGLHRVSKTVQIVFVRALSNFHQF